MGRLSEFCEFINRDKCPNENQKAVKYSRIVMDKEQVKVRMEYRKNLKKERSKTLLSSNG